MDTCAEHNRPHEDYIKKQERVIIQYQHAYKMNIYVYSYRKAIKCVFFVIRKRHDSRSCLMGFFRVFAASVDILAHTHPRMHSVRRATVAVQPQSPFVSLPTIDAIKKF